MRAASACSRVCFTYGKRKDLWQKKGQTVGLPAQAPSRRLSVLGFLGKQGHLHSFPTQEWITAEHLIQSIETLLPTLSKRCYLHSCPRCWC